MPELSNAVLDNLLQCAAAAPLRLDADGRVIDAGPALAALLAYPDSNALQQAIAEGLRPIDDWQQLIAAVSSANGRLRRRFTRLGRADGRQLHAWVNAVSAHDGNFDVLIISCEEVHSLRNSLEDAIARYQSIMEQSQNGVFVSTGQRLLFVNTAFAEMLAYQREELIGVPCYTLAHEDDREAVAGVYQPILAGEAGMSEFTVRLWMKGRIGLREVSVRGSRVWYEGAWCMLGTVYDITDLRRGEAALRDYARRLRLLSQQVIDVQEEERRHLARELHDEIGQQLTLVKLSLEAVRDLDSDSRALRDALSSVNELVQQIRSLSLDLRPSMLDDLGLGATLRWYASRAADVGRMQLSMAIDPEFPRMHPHVETLFFRIAQEAITNVLRHANARKLEVELSAHGRDVELIITDDGQGFDPGVVQQAVLAGRSSGVLGMQERAALGGAVLDVETAPGRGVRLRLVMEKACALPRVLSA